MGRTVALAAGRRQSRAVFEAGGVRDLGFLGLGGVPWLAGIEGPGPTVVVDCGRRGRQGWCRRAGGGKTVGWCRRWGHPWRCLGLVASFPFNGCTSTGSSMRIIASNAPS